jgi:hypothetical protein
MVLAFLAVVTGCNEDQLPPPPGDLAVDARLIPQSVTCESKGTMETCPAGDYCVWFEGGGVMCKPLPANCISNPTCACKPPLPNGTCACKDDGFGRIIGECH